MPKPTLMDMLASQVGVADWERRIGDIQSNLAYTVPSAPQYWFCLQRFIPPPWLTTEVKARTLIDVTFDGVVGGYSANLNTAGFLGAQVFHYSGGAYINPTQPPGTTDNSIPGFITDAGGAFVLSSEVYEPVSLPIGGVDYPIWTQQSFDPLTVRTYINDTENPGNLWGIAWVQVNDTLEEADACTVITHMRWDPVNDDSAPLYGDGVADVTRNQPGR